MAKKKILVVEDDNIIGMEIRDRVENLGYDVPAVLSYGEEAIAKVEVLKPDLILMDIQLRGKVDGIQAAEQIRRNYDIPVVYLTAYADDNTLQRAKITEPFGYVIKPFEERDLASTIEMALYKHQIDKKLKQSERWLATTLKSIGDGVIATDTDGEIKFMNPIAEQLTGWREREALGKKLDHVLKIIDEKSYQPIENLLAKIFEQKKIKELSDQYLLVSKNGTERPIMYIASPILNEKNEITGTVLIFQDNTERKRAQEYLRQQNRYNQLRANLWRLASDKSLSEDELITKMLELIGPVINVSRASYSKLFGNYLEDGEFKCILEWCEPGTKSAVGASFPASLVNYFLKKDILVVNRDLALKLIPKTLHSIAKSVILEFEKKYNLESILIVPHYLNNQVEGVLTFDICKDKKDKPIWTKEIKSIISEAVDIVTNFIVQKRNEQALRESEERFRTIFESTPDSMFIKDRFLTYTHINPAMGELLQKSASELIGLTDIELFGFEEWRKSKEIDSRVLKGEIVHEENTITIGGITKTFNVVKVPMRDHRGRIVGLCGIARDMTERKKVEEIQHVLYEISNAANETKDLRELFKSIQKVLGKILDTRNFFIALYNKDHDTITLPYHVDEMEKFTEIPAGKTMTSFVIKMQKPIRVTEEEIQKLAEKGDIKIVGTIPKIWLGVPLKIGRNVIGVIAVQSYKDESLYTEEHSNILEFVSGQIASAIERKKADEDRIRLATAIQQTAEAIMITDENACIQYVNPAFEKITGYTQQEVIGKTPRILKSGKQDKAFYKGLWETISNGKIWIGHFTNRKKDGSFYEEDTAISPIFDDSGKIINYVAVKRDVTEQLNMQLRLRQAEKMEAIGTLAGGIAHDFNNIIGAIIGYTELSLDDVTDERTKRNLKQVIKASHRAKDLVQQILAFSRQSEQKRKPLLVSLIVKEALKLLRASLPSTIEIRTNIQAKSSLVLADPTQIHQVMMNLCTNAAHAMREHGGVIEVSLREVEIDKEMVKNYQELRPGTYVKLMVKDTGVGIDPKIIDRIFEPYFTTKEVGQGAGMGLALVHGIVKSYNGEITVYSEKGKGTTFNVFLPRIFSKPKTQEQSEEGKKFLPTGNECILYVDDEKNLVNAGTQTLERLGYKVVSTTSSTEAFKIFKKKPEKFDLVITDQTMPEITGADLAQKLMRIRPDIPVILCTGYSEIISREKAKEMGISEFLMKPLFTEDIATVIRKVLDNK